MSDATESFGHRAAGISSVASFTTLEAAENLTDRFTDVDALVGEVLGRLLRVETVLQIEHGKRSDNVSLVDLSPRSQETLARLFAMEHQHARGAWYIPEKVSLKAGLANLPALYADHPRFASGLAWEERARVVPPESPAAVFVWAVLEPLIEQLLLPFELRGRQAGVKSREDQLAAWTSVDEIAAALGLEITHQLAVMRYGGGWSRLGAEEQLRAKQELLRAMAGQAREDMGTRYRAYRLLPLIERYYAKAKDGRARRKQVLTKSLERTLSGFFAGDWLAFVEYLGEAPHPDEEIASAVAETKLFVGGTKSAAAVAAETGISVEEVERMASTFWETATAGEARESPIDERVSALRQFWHTFDEVHAKQASGMRSLWGFVDESRSVRLGWEGPDWYNPRLYREMLPPGLAGRIEQLWGAVMLPRWPDRIVSEISPHALMAETFGPALAFWNGCALTAWFVCEGPMSRTDLPGLAAYHQEILAQLQKLGCPVDGELFEELRQAESRLGPPVSIEDRVSSVEVRPGISVEMRMSTGSRRSGFEHLRDIITRHRRAWSSSYLETYLRARWESEVREAARLHSQMIADRGKPPTPKQFARHAAAATNHWFGGDLGAFYAAIGEKSSVRPARADVMPGDRLAFAKRVFEHLGGRPFERKTFVSGREEAQVQAQEQTRHHQLGWLGEESLRFVQLQEALGRPPTLKEFGAGGFQYRAVALDPDVDRAWRSYAEVVEATLAQTLDVAAPPDSGGVEAPGVPPPPPPPDGQDASGHLERKSWLDRLRRK